jgi:hypothetical protein
MSYYVSLRSEFRVICVCLSIVVSNTHWIVFLFCFSPSCVPYDASFSGLFFFECPFGILLRLFDMLSKYQDMWPPF